MKKQQKTPPYHLFLPILTILLFFAFKNSAAENWMTDFQYQTISQRPQLEVRYTDATRTAFEIVAAEYHLTGELQQPHRLVNSRDQQPWLWFEFLAASGKKYSTQNFTGKSRINLYRRGPYYCEVHWLDIQAATATGELLPLKGDLALFCFPEKILAAITWHATEAVESLELQIRGVSPQNFPHVAIDAGNYRQFAFPLFGETAPLADSALTTREGFRDLKYEPLQGFYLIGSNTSNSFQKHFYEFPNRYEKAGFTIRNDARSRKIYICHKTIEGGAIVEGGIVLNAKGQPLPLLVQISKNFAGEKEEKFYNPADTPFSETFFPLYLEPFEAVTLTSLHLYQNWGRHPTKHWSSLGAWTDYFHSSTGVTETTCYVPFKFAHVPGVVIADFRAMSQSTFWAGQPQHDNVAGHSYVSYFTDAWQHSVYRQTHYRSTGPNWFDIGLEYTSADSAVEIIVNTWETPQLDELRSFFDIIYRIRRPLTIEAARKNFRLLEITSRIQSLRYTHVAASSLPAQKIDYSQTPFFITGKPLARENSWVAEFGDQRGSNGIVIQRFSGPGNLAPAFSLQVGSYQERFDDRPQDTRLLIVPDADRLELQPGDEFRLAGFWLPYGEVHGVRTVAREVQAFGTQRPKIAKVLQGTKLSDFPPRIQAHQNQAEFVLRGGRSLIPVVVSGLSNFRHPQLFSRQGDTWVRLNHSQCSETDGGQVFVDESGFGAVFLVPGSPRPMHLKISVRQPESRFQKLKVIPAIERRRNAIFRIKSDKLKETVRFQYHSVQNSTGAIEWHASEGNSFWFEKKGEIRTSGGRVTAFENQADLEFWWQNDLAFNRRESPVFKVDLTESGFDTANLADIFVSQNGRLKSLQELGWIEKRNLVIEVDSLQQKALFANRTLSRRCDFGFVAVRRKNRPGFVALVFRDAAQIQVGPGELQVTLRPQSVLHPVWREDKIETPKRRKHTRGKLYLSATSLAESFATIQRENLMPCESVKKQE